MKLVGIDVDGTLVGASGEVPASVWDAAERARAAGIRLVLCSGRPAFGVALDYARRLDATGWHIFQNGASVLDLDSGGSRSTGLFAAARQALIAQSRRTGDVLELYTDRDYATESAVQWAKQHAELLGVPFRPRSFDTLEDAVVRGQWVVGHADVERVVRDAPAELEVAVSSSPLMPDAAFVGMTRAGVNKGTGLRAIAAEYGIDLRDVMYVGDSDNDLSALRIVGHPVAMANASPPVLEAASRVVGHVDDGALAQALQFAIDG
ncbi:MAG TPA: HAD-IIB family hydrolase [Povalibacter sp.]|uniref:HAD-IIB family hydrolase n=1 Tax=Povalibacter sp. TaxID=1962978 RepID=UPI002C0D0A00|nr:HAD-IIB family hydrolase [Povalibacter sp.]HMN45921.1 HAD-IIB family hydrolase [Povalibacter sp.]